MIQEHDIDVGLVFNFTRTEQDPTEVKKWVYEAISNGRKVEYKRPCVRAQYIKEGEKAYHVDLAIYCIEGEQKFIAKGFPDSEPKTWEISEPERLKEIFKEKYNDEEDRNQFKRIIRYLKKWKDTNFSEKGNERPTGIVLTACALEWFNVSKTTDFHTGKNEYDDLNALKQLVERMNQFFQQDGELNINLPVRPGNNLFEKINQSPNHIQKFRDKLKEFKENLDKASKEPDPHEACKILNSVLGEFFPVPDKKDTAQPKKVAVASSSQSA